jgi:hypothetical protein
MPRRSRICRKPARAAAGPAAGRQARHGHRSGISHRLQGGLPGPPGQTAAPHHVYPHTGEGQARKSAAETGPVVHPIAVEAVAIGNGTAGRETETFVRALGLPAVVVLMVNESGASIYSASEVAREEFPTRT